MCFRTGSITVFLLALLFSACGENTGDEDTTPPDAPVMVEKYCDAEAPEYPEAGIDAEQAGAGIRLEWLLGQRSEDLEGFLVYRGQQLNEDSLGDFELISEDPGEFLVGSPEVFQFVDNGAVISPDIHNNLHRYNYFVRAVDGDGNMSAPSDSAHYTLYRTPLVNEVRVSGDSLHVTWSYDLLEAFLAGFHVLVVNPLDELVWFADVQEGFGQQDYQRSWVLEGENDLAPGNYRLRVDTIFARPGDDEQISSNPLLCPLAGSESEWISFQR